MGKNKEHIGANFVHLSSSNSDDPSTPYMEAGDDHRTKETLNLRQFSAMIRPLSPLSTIPTKITCDNIYSAPIVLGSAVNACAPTSEASSLDRSTVEGRDSTSSSRTNDDSGIDSLCSSDTNYSVPSSVSDEGPRCFVSTNKSVNQSLSTSNGIRSRATSSRMVVSGSSKEKWTCCDDEDEEVFADTIYEPPSSDYRDTKVPRQRSIRFSDEKEGQSLTTIHLIPWTEDDDASWLPRLEKCRMEV